MSTYDTIIIGAGAAGLMCALTAGRRGRRVLVLDRSNKVGKKILMSGGGRCNFTNLQLTPERFISANPHFCKSALSRYTQWDFIEMVERHGIEYFEKRTVNGLSGQLFCKDSSKRILTMLLDECKQAGVHIRTGCDISSVKRQDGYHLHSNQGRFAAESLVVASGGLSIPSLGGSGFAYQLAEQFGLNLLPTRAGLVPFTFSGATKALCRALSGLSCEAIVYCRETSFREDLLFTHRGLSGPAVLQASSYWHTGETIRVNLLPGMDATTLFKTWKRERPKALLRTLLAEKLPKKLIRELEALHWPGQAETALTEWPDRQLKTAATLLQAWELKPAATEGYRTAEVTLGGVDTHELSSRTMESQTPGLYFIGEALDVSGHLGGFNFQWAWSSGYAAGMAV